MAAVVCALGSSDEGRWLWLPLAGRQSWRRVLDGSQPVVLQELVATSADDDLGHPGDVPLTAETTLDEVIAMVDELGPDAVAVDARLLVATTPRLVFTAHDERSVRLEAETDEPFPPVLDRLAAIGPRRWRRVLQRLRYDALTERILRIETHGDNCRVRVYRDPQSFERDEVQEQVSFELDDREPSSGPA